MEFIWLLWLRQTCTEDISVLYSTQALQAPLTLLLTLHSRAHDKLSGPQMEPITWAN